MLKIVKTRNALDVRQRSWFGLLKSLEYLMAADRPLELADKLSEAVLHHPVEIDQIAVDVVDNLDGRWKTSKQ